MSTPADGRLHVGQQSDGRWRWTWTADDGFELVSNETYPEREEALGAATEAYPDAALDEEPGGRGTTPRSRRRRTALAVAALAGAFLAGRRTRVRGQRTGTGRARARARDDD